MRQVTRVSNHVLATPKEYNSGDYADAAESEKEDALTGGDPGVSVTILRKSAEGIVLRKRAVIDSRRSHQSKEGLNIKLFQMP